MVLQYHHWSIWIDCATHAEWKGRGFRSVEGFLLSPWLESIVLEFECFRDVSRDALLCFVLFWFHLSTNTSHRINKSYYFTSNMLSVVRRPCQTFPCHRTWQQGASGISHWMDPSSAYFFLNLDPTTAFDGWSNNCVAILSSIDWRCKAVEFGSGGHANISSSNRCIERHLEFPLLDK